MQVRNCLGALRALPRRQTHLQLCDAAHRHSGPLALLIRHGESVWNEADRFTGWVDVPLTERGMRQMRGCADELCHDEGLSRLISAVYTSELRRAVSSASILMDCSGMSAVPCRQDWRLNEREYGGLTGLRKREVRRVLGAGKFRRVWMDPPPSQSDALFSLNAHSMERLNNRTGESFEVTQSRALHFWDEVMQPHMARGETVAIVSSKNLIKSLLVGLRTRDRSLDVRAQRCGQDVPLRGPILEEHIPNGCIVKVTPERARSGGQSLISKQASNENWQR